MVCQPQLGASGVTPVKPGLFYDGVWQSHVHWRKTGGKRVYWQCRVVRSREDGRYKGVSHSSHAVGYVQFTKYYGVRYRFVLTPGAAIEKRWGNLVVPWKYLLMTQSLFDQHAPLTTIGELFMAYLAAERLCGRWGIADNLEWSRPHVLKPCEDCPPAIIYRLKQRGVQGLRWPSKPKGWWPSHEPEMKRRPAKIKRQLELFSGR